MKFQKSKKQTNTNMFFNHIDYKYLKNKQFCDIEYSFIILFT